MDFSKWEPNKAVFPNNPPEFHTLVIKLQYKTNKFCRNCNGKCILNLNFDSFALSVL